MLCYLLSKSGEAGQWYVYRWIKVGFGKNRGQVLGRFSQVRSTIHLSCTAERRVNVLHFGQGSLKMNRPRNLECSYQTEWRLVNVWKNCQNQANCFCYHRHSLGYSSNSLGPKTDLENAHVHIPNPNCPLSLFEISTLPSKFDLWYAIHVRADNVLTRSS